MIRYCKVIIIFLLCLPLLKQDILPGALAIQSSDVLGSSTVASKSSPLPSATPVRILIKPSPIANPSPKPSPTTRMDLVQLTLDLNSAVNVWRKARGQGPLAADDQVCKAVGERAKEIATDFSHDKFMDAVRRNNIDYKAVSENIAMNSRITAARVVDQWDKSPHHHEAMIGDFNFGCGSITGNYAAFMFLKR